MFPKLPRPHRLSNLNCCYSDEDISAIDAKHTDSLSWRDFEAIFALSECTAEYDEQLYYLPLALRYLEQHPDEGNAFLAGLVQFIASHRDGLDVVGFLESALTEVRTCFHLWTAEFRVVHFDAAACAAKGWRVDHSDCVEHSSSVRGLIDALLRYGLSHLADDLVASWTRPDRRAEHAAWLLEFAKQEREAYAYYSREGAAAGHVDMTPSRRSKRIVSIIIDNQLLQTAYDGISGSLVVAEPSPTYWRDLVSSLGLTA